jgi:ParB family transcriptional regulator, chromosome partitioning protein
MQETRDIPMHLIVSNRFQPRLTFPEEALRELAASIEANGLIQPISVRPVEGKYEIVAGERRFRALKLLNAHSVPAIIMHINDAQMAEMALVENIQREDLSAIEEAKAFVLMLNHHALTQEKIAAKIGKSQSSVANKIRLLQLPQEIQDAISEHRITERHARALLGVHENKQSEIFHKIIQQQLNVRQTEALIENIKEEKKVVKKQIRGITRNLQIALNTIHAAINMIKKTGVNVSSEQDDHDDHISITIRFPK